MKTSGKPNLVVAGLLDYLDETGQSRLLPEVTRQLEQLLEESKTAQAITVTSFMPLTEVQESQLKEILARILKTPLPLVNQVDQKLLGGFTIKVGDWFLDASLAQELRYLRSLVLT